MGTIHRFMSQDKYFKDVSTDLSVEGTQEMTARLGVHVTPGRTGQPYPVLRVPGSVPTVLTFYDGQTGPLPAPTCCERHPRPQRLARADGHSRGHRRSPEVPEQVLFCFGFSFMTSGRS